MPTRRSTQALLHVRDNVLGYDETSPFWIYCLFRGITKMSHLLACDETALMAVYTNSTDGTEFTLPAAIQQEILMLRRWLADQDDQSVDGWLTLDEETFDTYAQENADYVPPPDSALAAAAAARSSRPAATPSKTYDVFERNVKPSIDDYPAITDESNLLSWLEEVRPIAAFHQAEDVLDSDYVPATDEEQHAFDLRQKFMFAMLAAKVKYGDGELIVREHAKTSDAQAIFAALLDNTATGLSGVHYADMIEEEIKHMRFQPGLETGRAFLTKFVNRLIDLGDARATVDPDDTVADRDKRKWLTKAIRSANEDCKLALAGVTAQEGHAGQQLSWKKFYKFIHGTLTAADLRREEENAEAARLGITQQRQINQTDIGRSTDGTGGGDGGGGGGGGGSSHKTNVDKFLQRCKDTGFYVQKNVWENWDKPRQDEHAARRKAAWAAADAAASGGSDTNTDPNANVTETTPAAAPAPSTTTETTSSETTTTSEPPAETGSTNVDRSINNLMSSRIAQSRQVSFGARMARTPPTGSSRNGEQNLQLPPGLS